jgi:hypothetical protein
MFIKVNFILKLGIRISDRKDVAIKAINLK